MEEQTSSSADLADSRSEPSAFLGASFLKFCRVKEGTDKYV